MIRHPGLTEGPGWVRLITGEMHPMANSLIATTAEGRSDLKAKVEPLATRNLPTAVMLAGHASGEENELLTGLGYFLAETMPMMAVEIDRLAETILPGGYTFHEVKSGGEDVDEWVDMLNEGYGLTRPTAELFGPAQIVNLPADQSARWFAVKRDGLIVTTSMLYVEGGLPGIYCVSTTEPERRKGLAAHATAEPLRPLKGRYATGILQASAIGEPVYRKLGFEQHETLALYVKLPSS